MKTQIAPSFQDIEQEVYELKKDGWIRPIPSEKYKVLRAWVKYWHKYDNEFCQEGDLICTVVFQTEVTNYEKEYYSNSSGLIETELPRFGLFPEKDFQDKQVLFSIDSNKKKSINQGLEADQSHDKEICYLYLMHDSTNHFYKIGISNNPKYRERTLQSEKPTIELLASKPYPTRELAKSFEKALHNTYSHKRIRGEWFHLDEQDVENLRKLLE